MTEKEQSFNNHGKSCPLFEIFSSSTESQTEEAETEKN